MAKITGDVWDDLAKQLMKAEKNMPGIMNKAIKKAATRYVLETKKAMYRLKVIDKGLLEAAVKPGTIRRLPNGRMVEVWPQGNRYDKKHPNGERNETIAFVTVHGRPGKYAGRDYLTAADAKAGPKAAQEIADMLQEAFTK